MKKFVKRPNGCWLWHGTLCFGYGKFPHKSKGKWIYSWAHRYAYELFVGKLREGMQIDHLCRNRACVNPAHLEQVTQTVNLARGDSPPAINARKKKCNKGHMFDAKNTGYRKDRNGRYCKRCSYEALRDRRKRLAVSHPG